MPVFRQVGMEMAVAKSRPLVVVTGATGAVGPLVVKAFQDEGYSIRTLSLDPPPGSGWPDNVETVLGDVTDRSTVDAALRGAEAVVHLAALLHIADPSPALRERYERINVGGTANVVAAAVRAGVGRLVLFSTIAVYGPSGGRILTEDSPPCPDTLYARTKLEAEKIVLGARGADGAGIGVVLRLGSVYGRRVKGNYRRLVRALASGRFVPIGAGSNRRTLIYDRDAARAAVLAAVHPEAAGRIFNVTDGQFHTLGAVLEAICGALGRKPPRWTLPAGSVRFLAGLLEDGVRLFGFHSPITRATIDKYTEDMAVDGSCFQSRIGFVPRYDLIAGWRETVDEMRSSGEI